MQEFRFVHSGFSKSVLLPMGILLYFVAWSFVFFALSKL